MPPCTIKHYPKIALGDLRLLAHFPDFGPQLQVETLSDGSKVYNVTITEETIFCVDERHALQLIDDLNEAAIKAQ